MCKGATRGLGLAPTARGQRSAQTSRSRVPTKNKSVAAKNNKTRVEKRTPENAKTQKIFLAAQSQRWTLLLVG